MLVWLRFLVFLLVKRGGRSRWMLRLKLLLLMHCRLGEG